MILSKMTKYSTIFSKTQHKSGFTFNYQKFLKNWMLHHIGLTEDLSRGFSSIKQFISKNYPQSFHYPINQV